MLRKKPITQPVVEVDDSIQEETSTLVSTTAHVDDNTYIIMSHSTAHKGRSLSVLRRIAVVTALRTRCLALRLELIRKLGGASNEFDPTEYNHLVETLATVQATEPEIWAHSAPRRTDAPLFNPDARFDVIGEAPVTSEEEEELHAS